MPFRKKDESEKFYTGLSFLKHSWIRIIEHVDSTPAQITYALRRLEYLCAETKYEKKMKALSLLAEDATKIGFKTPADYLIPSGESEGQRALEPLVDKMFQHLHDRKSGEGNV